MKKVSTILGLALGVLFFTGCGNQGSGPAAAEQAPAQEEASQEKAGQAFLTTDESGTPNILGIAIGSPDHKTLVAAVQAAEIENVLANNGPITVFAPTDAAFAALPEGTVENLVKPENKATLARILTFHAAPGSYDAEHIAGVMGIGQATGDKVVVEEKDGATYVNGAKVLGSVKASNGWVHVIDAVLLPPEK
ncbi:MAG: fasciclin [Crocinitomicaceae bacterium]|nr:fasciclin [Crocinitomicaceae bacterium]|tara:strand:+ start:4225 stop:4803 length:579 start_codon:yes stop_codon:yes gene_type:complete